MATFKYNAASNMFATRQWDWTALDVNAALVSENYGALPSHLTLADIDPSALVVRDQVLTDLAVSASGVCSGVIPPFNALLSAAKVIGVLLYVLGASDAESALIYYSSDGAGFPFIPAGFNYSVAFDQTAGGWFQV